MDGLDNLTTPSSTSQQNNDSNFDGTFDMPPEALAAVEKALSPGELEGSLTAGGTSNTTTTTNTHPTSGKGAQILMSRFSTWRLRPVVLYYFLFFSRLRVKP